MAGNIISVRWRDVPNDSAELAAYLIEHSDWIRYEAGGNFGGIRKEGDVWNYKDLIPIRDGTDLDEFASPDYVLEHLDEMPRQMPYIDDAEDIDEFSNRWWRHMAEGGKSSEELFSGRDDICAAESLTWKINTGRNVRKDIDPDDFVNVMREMSVQRSHIRWTDKDTGEIFDLLLPDGHWVDDGDTFKYVEYDNK